MLRTILTAIFLLPFICLKAQNGANNFVFSSPKGNYILLPKSQSATTASARAAISIERSKSGQSSFVKTGSFTPVESYGEFEKMVGAEVASAFKNHVHAKSNEEVVQVLNNAADVSKFGLFILNADFLRAAGLAFLDAMPERETVQYEYRLTDGSKTIAQQAAIGFQKNLLPKGNVKELFTTDSLVRIRWQLTPTRFSLPLFGLVYRQDGGQGTFRALLQAITINNEDGQLTAFFEERKSPEHIANYYMVTMDMFGNEGHPSDTISAITVDFKKIPGIADLSITDTADGLYCQWKPLPQKPYYTGIQVLRSRDPMKDFIVLDSLPASAYFYLDKQVLPNITYYYKFRPIVYKISGWDEIIATTVTGTKTASKTPPLPPKNLQAFHEGRNIKLTWDANTELDMFAYYVLRGTTPANLEIVSSALTDTTWTDTTENLNGRLNYVYSVLAMNNSQLKSTPSRSAGIRPERGEFIEPPSGLTIRRQGEKVLISWPDMSGKDISVAGYILYRKKATEKDFLPVQNNLITNPFYEDVSAEKNTRYRYVVTAVDYGGYESAASPEAEFSNDVKVSPPSTFFVRKLSTGVEISWPVSDDGDIISYNIYRRMPTETNYLKIGSVKASERLFIDKRSVANKLNVYALSVSTITGESEKSIERSLFITK